MKTLLPLFLFLAGCNLAPTKVKEEVVGPETEVVFADTRGAFNYESYHVSGSIAISTGDFLLLKNARTRRRILDPDLAQTVERLAQRGIHPLKKIVLIGESADSLENKKWNWFLRRLGVVRVEMASLESYRRERTSLVPRPGPTRAESWTIENTEEILKKADTCFVNWSEADCR